MKTTCTNSDYVKFIGYCRDYIDKLRLGNWEVDYKFDKSAEVDRYADCHLDYSTLKATITLYADWSPDAVNQTSLREIAYHEVAHILFAPLLQAADNEESEAILREHEHNIIKQMCLYSFRPRKHK